MRVAALPALALLLSSAASAQLTLLPQVGVESSKTSVQYNDLSSFSPLGSEASARASVRLDYRLKGGHGPFLGAATSPSPVEYNFTNPTTGGESFQASTGNLQWRLEGGWMYSSKPITFKKNKAPTTAQSTQTTEETVVVKKSCGSYVYKSHCNSSREKTAAPPAEKTALTMRIQPFVGAAYNPSTGEDIIEAPADYTYKAGNWNTAFLAGTGFEFGKGSRRLFTINVQYLKGLGNLDEKTLVAETDGKVTTTRLSSSMSSWNVALGLPFTLGKKKAAPAPQQKAEPQTKQKSKCGEYRYKCTRKVVI
jgi:hypothetical protein